MRRNPRDFFFIVFDYNLYGLYKRNPTHLLPEYATIYLISPNELLTYIFFHI